MGKEEPDRKEREGTISKAYCFETDSIDGPFLAVEKRAIATARGSRLHYFCPTEDCAYPMRGPTLKRRPDYDIAYFESKRRGNDTPPNHVPQCPFIITERKSTARGESRPPTYTPFQPPPLFIPEVLVNNTQDFHRAWDDEAPPSREALVTMITHAETRPVHGSIEDVMAAERIMARAYKVHKQSEETIPPPEHKKSRWSRSPSYNGPCNRKFKYTLILFSLSQISAAGCWSLRASSYNAPSEFPHRSAPCLVIRFRSWKCAAARPASPFKSFL